MVNVFELSDPQILKCSDMHENGGFLFVVLPHLFSEAYQIVTHDTSNKYFR